MNRNAADHDQVGARVGKAVAQSDRRIEVVAAQQAALPQLAHALGGATHVGRVGAQPASPQHVADCALEGRCIESAGAGNAAGPRRGGRMHMLVGMVVRRVIRRFIKRVVRSRQGGRPWRNPWRHLARRYPPMLRRGRGSGRLGKVISGSVRSIRGRMWRKWRGGSKRWCGDGWGVPATATGLRRRRAEARPGRDPG